MLSKGHENKTFSYESVWKTVKVMLFRTTLVGTLGGLTNYLRSVLTTSRSPSLIIQVSYLYGLYETFMILILRSISSSDSETSWGQGSSLQALVKMGSPIHGRPSGTVGSIHTL
jgi:hypothetical protein